MTTQLAAANNDIIKLLISMCSPSVHKFQLSCGSILQIQHFNVHQTYQIQVIEQNVLYLNFNILMYVGKLSETI